MADAAMGVSGILGVHAGDGSAFGRRSGGAAGVEKGSRWRRCGVALRRVWGGCSYRFHSWRFGGLFLVGGAGPRVRRDLPGDCVQSRYESPTVKLLVAESAISFHGTRSRIELKPLWRPATGALSDVLVGAKVDLALLICEICTFRYRFHGGHCKLLASELAITVAWQHVDLLTVCHPAVRITGTTLSASATLSGRQSRLDARRKGARRRPVAGRGRF